MRNKNSKNCIQVPLDSGYVRAIPNSIAKIDWFLVHNDNQNQNVEVFAGSIDKTIFSQQIHLSNQFRVKNQRFFLYFKF